LNQVMRLLMVRRMEWRVQACGTAMILWLIYALLTEMKLGWSLVTSSYCTVHAFID
jgi:hypothetical protein